MKKIIALFALITSLVFTLTVGAEVSFEITNNFPEITISGNTGGEIPYENVTVCVVNPGGNVDDISNLSVLKENLLYYSQKNADENGNFSFDIELDEENIGRYIVFVYSSEDKKKDEVFYITSDGIKSIIEQINQKSTVEGLEEIIDLSSNKTDTVLIFNLEDELVFRVPQDNLLAVFLNLNSINEVNPQMPEELKDKITLSAVITALNEGMAFDLVSYDNVIGLPAEYKEAYFLKLSDDVKLNFSKGFLNKPVTDKLSLNNEFKNRVILSILNNIRNRSDIEYVIEKFGGHLNINVSSFMSFVNKPALVDQLGTNAPYGSVEEFTSKYNTLYSALMVAPPPSAGGGGGGGTSSSKFNDVSDEPVSSEKFDPFSDVFSDLDKTPWAKEYIMKLYDKGIIKGVSENEFAPDKNIKREEFIKILVEALQFEAGNDKPAFTDADENTWYYEYLLKAYSKGIVNGYSDGSFGVGKYITREDMITLSYRAALCKEMAFSEEAEKFADDTEISDYAKTAVYSFRNAGIIQGSGNNLVNPKSFLTRAEAAKIICMLME